MTAVRSRASRQRCFESNFAVATRASLASSRQYSASRQPSALAITSTARARRWSISGEAQALLVTRQGLRPLIVDAHGSGTLSVLRTAAAPGAAYPELHVGSLFVVQRDELGTLTGAPG